MIYIFDIDGTLADLSHRLHFIQKEPKDWDGFFEACDDDKPIDPVMNLLLSLREAGDTVLLLTGRSDSVRDKTHTWLRNHLIGYDGMYMRKSGDHRPDHIVKPELMEQLLKEWRRDAIVAIFEDRARVVKAFRDLGFTVFQVAEGNF